MVYVTDMGSSQTGRQEGVIRTMLACVLSVPQYVPSTQRFDLLVLVSTVNSSVTLKAEIYLPKSENRYVSYYGNIKQLKTKVQVVLSIGLSQLLCLHI